jgi:hypothetical protein
LLSHASHSPREFLPTTEHSIIWQQPEDGGGSSGSVSAPAAPVAAVWKLYTAAGKSSWYPPALGFNMSGMIEADKKEWPCVGTSNSSFFGGKENWTLLFPSPSD